MLRCLVRVINALCILKTNAREDSARRPHIEYTPHRYTPDNVPFAISALPANGKLFVATRNTDKDNNDLMENNCYICSAR